MLHYKISESGELAFSPQFYYAAKNVRMGAYGFPQGMFFCGEINFLKATFRVMYCALDGHLELCGIFGVDTQILYMDRQISIYAMFALAGIPSVTVDLVVSYASFLNSQFKFRIAFDAEPLYEKLDELRGYVKDLAKRMKEKFSKADEQLRIVESQVLSLQNQINDLERAIDNSKNRISNAKWWQFWIAVAEGAKILGYETAIAALNLSMGVVLAALELARAAVKAVSM